MKPTKIGHESRFVATGLSEVQPPVAGGKENAPIGKIRQADDAVIFIGTVVAKIELERRGCELLQTAVVLDQSRLRLRSRFRTESRNIDVALDIGKEVARNMARNGAHLDSFHRTTRGVVLVQNMTPIAQRIDVTSDAADRDQTLGDRLDVLPETVVRINAPKVTTPPGQRRAVILFALLVRRGEIEPAIASQDDSRVNLYLALTLAVQSRRLQLIDDGPTVAPSVGLRCVAMQVGGGSGTAGGNADPDSPVQIASRGAPDAGGSDESWRRQLANFRRLRRVPRS